MTTEHGYEEHLRAIRQLIERAAVYRAIAAPTALVGGFLSLTLSIGMLRWQMRDDLRNIDAHQFFDAWMLVLTLSLAANLVFLWRAASQRGEPLVSTRMKLAVGTVAPSFFAGIALSGVLTVTSGIALLLTLMWLVFYGLALLSTMSFAPRSIIVLGWAFLFTGTIAFIYFMNQTLLPELDLPTPTRFYPAGIMGATFGLYHLVYAMFTWPRRARVLDEIERRPLVTESHPPLP